jgi:hypothetical protein
MFLRHTRADKQQESFDFCLRKPKKSHVQSPNIFSHNDDTANTNFITTSDFLTMQRNDNFSMDNFLDNDVENFSIDENIFHDFNEFSDNQNSDINEQEYHDTNTNRKSDDDTDTNRDFDEQMYDTDTDTNKESDDDTNRDSESDEQEYDGKKQKYYYSGNTGPYFPNFTTFLLFLWITKHQIGI